VPAFNASLLVNLAGVFFVFGIFFFQNQYLQLVLRLSPLQAGLWSLAPSLVFTVMSLQAWRVTNRFGPIHSVIGGLIINAVGAACMGLAAYFQSLYGILGASMIIGLGFVPVILTTTGLIVGSAPPERAGAASAISETSAEFGGALGVALLGSLGTLIYRAKMAATDISAVPIDAVATSRATLGGAVEAAKKVDAADLSPAYLAFLDTARQAFANGFAATCLIAAITLIILAWIAARVYAVSDVKVGGH
jgi:MFS transporter, DHA2 family, multidrug resistance protein